MSDQSESTNELQQNALKEQQASNSNPPSGQSSDQEQGAGSPEAKRKHSTKCKLSQPPHHHHHHHHHHTHSPHQSEEMSKSAYSTATDQPAKSSESDQQTLQQQLQILVNTVDTNVSKLVDKDQQQPFSPTAGASRDGHFNLGYQNTSLTSIYNTTQSAVNKSATGGGPTHTLTLSKSHNYPNHCHTSDSANPGIDKSARKKLIIASLLCLLFMIGETIGGLLANSLAIATDAAHLLTDFASFMISLFSIWMASRPATKKMSFGYYRSEVIGALTSVLLIWVVTGILVLMAVQRLVSGQYDIDAPIMLITAAIGVVVNIM